MHKDKHHRKFRHYYPVQRPSEIQKDILPFDTCEIFPYRRVYWCQARSKWVDGLEQYDLSGLCREDPFGINNYHLRFSLDKKKRWEIPEEIGERIEEIQDPHTNLRVSAFVRDIDRTQWRLNRFADAMDYLGCVDYHTVARDGAVSHRHSNKHKTRVRSFTHPDPQQPRKVKGQPRQERYRESKDSEGFDLPFDEKLRCQLLHISYTITLYSASPSLHNKASQDSRLYFPRKPSKKYHSNAIAVEDDREWEADEVDDDYDDDDLIGESSPPSTVDFSSLIVRRAKRQRKKTGSITSDIPQYKEDEDDFVVVENS